MNPTNVLTVDNLKDRRTAVVTWKLSCHSSLKFPTDSEDFRLPLCGDRKFYLRIHQVDDVKKVGISLVSGGPKTVQIRYYVEINTTSAPCLSYGTVGTLGTTQMLIKTAWKQHMTASGGDVSTIQCCLSTCTMQGTTNHLESNMWRYYDMIDSGSADFKIVIAQDQSVIGVHKLVLETHWPHFRRMMDSGMIEARSSSWEIEEFDYCTMKSLIMFIYTGVTHILNASDAADVLRAAHVYDLKILFDQVATNIVSVLSDADVLKVLPLAHLHNLSDVKLKCFEVLVSSLRSSKKSIDSLVGYKAFEDDPTFKLLIREVLTFSMK